MYLLYIITFLVYIVFTFKNQRQLSKTWRKSGRSESEKRTQNLPAQNAGAFELEGEGPEGTWSPGTARCPFLCQCSLGGPTGHN